MQLFRQLNPYACRTYLLGNEVTKEVLLVDPVLDQVPVYLNLLDQEQFKLIAVIDTHTHADHISGAAALLDKTQCEYLMHKKAAASCPSSRISEGMKLDMCGIPIRVMETPGHTKDSITLVLPDKILTGDALFLDDGGAGRDDLPGGDPSEHWDSLQRILGLSEELVIYPAHEYRKRQPSTLKQQKITNPHLKPKTREEYIRYVQDLKLGPAEWMKEVLKANYACARDPKAAWIPVDVPACEIKGTLNHGANDIQVFEINSNALKEKLDLGKWSVLLDVRDPQELKEELGAFDGVLNIPVSELTHRLAELEQYKNKEIITICRSGGRAHTAAQILIQAGFKNVKKLTGGMTAWKKSFDKA